MGPGREAMGAFPLAPLAVLGMGYAKQTAGTILLAKDLITFTGLPETVTLVLCHLHKARQGQKSFNNVGTWN